MKPQRKRSAQPESPPPVRAKSWRHSLAIAALGALTLLVYSNSLHAGFTLDNKGLIVEDPRLRAVDSQNIQQIFDRTYWWPTGESGLYRPVTTLSYLFNYSILGNRDQPEGYHWVNLLLQLANVLLVYALALRLWREFWPAVFTAAIWAAHPILTESVTNIVGRADLLAGMAVLGSLLLYLKSKESAGWRRWAWLAAVVAVSAFGMFAKESAAVIPAVIVLYEFGRGRWAWTACAATLLPLASMLYVRSRVLAAAGPALFPFTDNPLVAADFWTQKLTALKVMGNYLGLLLWPAKLSADYSFAQIPLAHGSLADWLAWTAVVAAAALAAMLYRRQPSAFFLAAFAFITLLPASNLLFPIGTVMAERLLYLPAIALAGCVAAGACAALRHLGRPALAPALLGLVTALLAVRTLARNADWQNDLTLATATVRASPNSFKAHKMMADALFRSDDSHANLDQAIEEIDRSLAIIDPLPDYRNNAQAFRMAAGFYLLKGDMQFRHDTDPPPGAREAYRHALPLALRYESIVAKTGASGSKEDAQEVLASAYLRNGDAANALHAAREARNLAPFQASIYRVLSDALLASGHAEDAAAALFEGALLTSDRTLRARLVDLYRSGLDSEGCALVAGPSGPAINPRCGTVRRQICSAAPEALRSLANAGRLDELRSLKVTLIEDSGCSAAALNQAALPE